MSETGSSGNWNDLAPRIVSAVVMAVVGFAALWAGGVWFTLLIAFSCALMVWEVVRMTNPDMSISAIQMAGLGGAAIALVAATPGFYSLPFLIAPGLVSLSLVSNHRPRVFIYVSLILLAGAGFLAIRGQLGLVWMLWFVLVVIATDVAGYFAGRIVGGPKFWPRISPKKTWSGTIAGWISAGLISVGFVLFADFGVSAIFWGPILSFGSQLGDIAESALKRRVGIKDSSGLIPGHGGVMDRFDGMMGASITFLALWVFLAPPMGG